MKGYLFLPIFLIVINCTTLKYSLEESISKSIKDEIMIKIEELKGVVKENEIDRLEEIFLPTLKNEIITNSLKEYNLKELTFIFSEVTPVSKVKARVMMIINYREESNYYIITWKKDNVNGQWKILNVAAKK